MTLEVLDVKRGQRENVGEKITSMCKELEYALKAFLSWCLVFSGLPFFHLSFRFFFSKMSVTIISGLLACGWIYTEMFRKLDVRCLEFPMKYSE